MSEGKSPLTEVLLRAQEIDAHARHHAATEEEIQEFVRAAEEAGISREATLQALRERLNYVPGSYAVGETVFARSGDDRFYLAKIASIAEGCVTAEFLNGGKATVTLGDLRPYGLTPGQRVEVDSAICFSWVGARLVSVNLTSMTAQVNWGMPEMIPLANLRLPRERKGKHREWLLPLLVGSAGTLAGGAIGAVVTWLLMR